jgi:hypothetical protein
MGLAVRAAFGSRGAARQRCGHQPLMHQRAQHGAACAPTCATREGRMVHGPVRSRDALPLPPRDAVLRPIGCLTGTESTTPPRTLILRPDGGERSRRYLTGSAEGTRFQVARCAAARVRGGGGAPGSLPAGLVVRDPKAAAPNAPEGGSPSHAARRSSPTVQATPYCDGAGGRRWISACASAVLP